MSDFGLSRLLPEHSPNLGSNADYTGTVTHMAPELLQHGSMSRAADVYSFGILSKLPACNVKAHVLLHHGQRGLTLCVYFPEIGDGNWGQGLKAACVHVGLPSLSTQVERPKRYNNLPPRKANTNQLRTCLETEHNKLFPGWDYSCRGWKSLRIADLAIIRHSSWWEVSFHWRMFSSPIKFPSNKHFHSLESALSVRSVGGADGGASLYGHQQDAGHVWGSLGGA